MSKLSLLVLCGLIGLSVCKPMGGDSREDDGDGYGDVVPVPVAQFMAERIGDKVGEEMYSDPGRIKEFHDMFLKYLYQRHKHQEAKEMKEKFEGKEDKLHALFMKFVMFMKAKKAEMGGGSSSEEDMGGMGGDMGGDSMGGDSMDGDMKMKKMMMMKAMFHKFVAFMMHKKAAMAGGDSMEGGDMGGMGGGDMGGMGGGDSSEEDSDEKEMDPMKKMKLKFLWEEMLQWDKSVISGMKLFEKGMSREDTARVFFEIFLRFMKASKGLEEKAKKAAYVIKHVQASQGRAEEEEKHKMMEEKMKKMFKMFMYHMKEKMMKGDDM